METNEDAPVGDDAVQEDKDQVSVGHPTSPGSAPDRVKDGSPPRRPNEDAVSAEALASPEIADRVEFAWRELKYSLADLPASVRDSYGEELGGLLGPRMELVVDLLRSPESVSGGQLRLIEYLPDQYVNDLRLVLDSIRTRLTEPNVVERLVEELDYLLVAGLRDASEDADSHVQPALRALANSAESMKRLDKITREASTARDRAKEAAQTARAAAGEGGSFALADSFDMYARAEERKANTWRVVALLCFIGLAALAFYFLGRTTDSSTATVLRKLGSLLPVAAIAGYAARESASHRDTSRWAKSLAVQLQTVQAYIQPLDRDRGADILQALGMKVFVGYAAPSHPGRMNRKSGVPSVDSATELLQKVIELLKTEKGDGGHPTDGAQR